jgi:hypothetical protein
MLINTYKKGTPSLRFTIYNIEYILFIATIYLFYANLFARAPPILVIIS